MDQTERGLQLLTQYAAEKTFERLTSKIANLTSSVGSIQSAGDTYFQIRAPTVKLQVKAPSEEEVKDRYIQELSPSSALDDRADLLYTKETIVSESFQWILKSAEYRSWERADSGTQLLWMYGPPGTGKTMFSLFLTQEFDKKDSETSANLYYFCDRKPDRRSPARILRGLMKSLIVKSGEARDYVTERRNQGDPMLSQLIPLWRIFTSMVNNSSFQTIYCVIDGLDQCSETSMDILERFVHILKRDFDKTKDEKLTGIPTASATVMDPTAANTRKPAFKLAVLSRDEPSCLKDFQAFRHIHMSKVESTKNDACQSTMVSGSSGSRVDENKVSVEMAEVAIEERFSTTDIPPPQQPTTSSIGRSDGIEPHTQDMTGLKPPSDTLKPYIRKKMDQLCKEKDWGEGLKSILEERLLRYNKGTFLWVEAAVNTLSKLSQREAQRVQFASETTQSMWCSILQDIPNDLKAPARFLLKWLSIAFVPLNIIQLEEVWCWCFFPGSRYTEGCRMIQEALDACGILLTKSENGDLNIKHQEVRNFLTQSPSLWGASQDIHPFFFTESDGHCEIAKVSLNYLEQSIFRHHACHTDIDNKTGGILFDEEEDYTDRHPFIQYSARFWPEHAKKATLGGIDFDSSFFSPGNIARRNWSRAAWGFACHRGSEQCPKFQTRLHVAAFFDLQEWAQYLCSHEESTQRLEKRNSDLMTPLFVAAARESTKVFTVLLEHGAERTIMDENVFHFACRIGSRAIVRLLLERKVDVNETTSAIGLLQCLTPAFRLLPGFSGIVSMRKSSDWEDVLFLQYFGEKTTPLHNAVLGGHEDIVEMLLAHDPRPDVNRGTLQNGTAAHIAAWKSTPYILELLKQSGADFTLRTSTGWLPIHCAAVHGNEATIQWLLNNGASINSVTTSGETALHLAAQYGLYHTAKLLLDSNATIDAKTVDGLTPLHIAAQSGQDNLVLVLLLYNADPDMLAMDGKTAVQLAESASKSSTVQILQSAERMEKDPEGRMTSEENFGIPYIGTPQIKLPAFVLSAIKTGLSKMEASESKKAPRHLQRYDEDDHELSRHGKRNQHQHHHDRNDKFDENVPGKIHHERAPSRKLSVRFDDEQ